MISVKWISVSLLHLEHFPITEMPINLAVISTTGLNSDVIFVNIEILLGLSRFLINGIMLKELLGLIWDLISGN